MIKKMLESAEAEEKADEWLDKLPCHLYTFYHTIKLKRKKTGKDILQPGRILERHLCNKKIS